MPGSGYEVLIPSLALPDPNDRHVLAAAIAGRCDVIVTSNLTDFPEAALADFDLEIQLPDTFLSNHLHLAPGIFLNAVRKVRGRLKNPPYTIDEYLETLNRQGLIATVSGLREYSSLL